MEKITPRYPNYLLVTGEGMAPTANGAFQGYSVYPQGGEEGDAYFVREYDGEVTSEAFVDRVAKESSHGWAKIYKYLGFALLGDLPMYSNVLSSFDCKFFDFSPRI